MRKGSLCGVLALLMVMVSNAPAERWTLSDGARVSVAVSNTDPNYLRVSDDPIRSIQATQGRLSAQSATSDGAVVFSTLAHRPFTLFIQTQSGFAFSLQARPEKRPGKTLIVDNQHVHGTAVARQFEQQQNTYSTLIGGLITRFMRNTRPAGYVVTQNHQVTVSTAMASALIFRPVNAWQGDRLRIVRTDVTSRFPGKLPLREGYFWSPDVMAVALHPHPDVLEPGATVSVIILLRTPGDGHEHQ